MCCFSVARPVGWLARWRTPRVHVSRTNLFARRIAPGVQALAYGMDLTTTRELAMVLPLPVAPGTDEAGVTFVDLSAHPRMFDELAQLFALPAPQAKRAGPISRSAPPLPVHAVGAFVASYVPTRAAFARLDPRFRIPEVLFDAVPHYADHGFAVFQLAPGKVTVHPMALRFPTRAPDRLFFPTVHVHDGRFHTRAAFDHALYYQTPGPTVGAGPAPRDADASSVLAPTITYAGLVSPGQPVLRRTLRATLPNADTWIPG